MEERFVSQSFREVLFDGRGVSQSIIKSRRMGMRLIGRTRSALFRSARRENVREWVPEGSNCSRALRKRINFSVHPSTDQFEPPDATYK